MQRIAAAAAALALLVAACDRGPVGRARPRRGGVLRLGVTRLLSLDPAQARTPDQLLAADQLFDGLTSVDPDTQSPRPAIAVSWAATADQRQWEFKLRPGARFANGRQITSIDVKYSLERVARHSSGSPGGDLLELVTGFAPFAEESVPDLAGVSAPTPDVVRVTLDQPWALLPTALSNPTLGIVPRESVEAPAPGPPFDEHPVGSGPFRIEQRAGDRIALVPRPGAAVHVDRLDLVQFGDGAQAYRAFTAGRVDWARVPAEEVASARRRYGDDLFRPLAASLFYGMNLKSPKFGDARFREAIVRAIDRDAIAAAVYHDTARSVRGVVTAGIPGYDEDPCGTLCRYDPARSRSLVRAVFGAGSPPELFIDFDAGPGRDAVAQAMKAGLAAVGIQATLRAKSEKDYQAFVGSGQQELFRMGWVAAYPSMDAFLPALFGQGSPSNLTGFADPAVDEQLRAARSERSPRARYRVYADAERAIVSQLPVVPLVQFQSHVVTAGRVHGVVMGVLGTFDAAKAWVSR